MIGARCFAYLRNCEDAEDAAQEAELRVFRAIRSFRQDASFRTWLFAIGDRQCHDIARKRSRHILSDNL
ncbi:MAG: RNA polymerase sigma-70 factor (ECF subfamily) [Parasphingorhabdus sp.]|jgi:RNA polymerase sigma-70 factor (ECF subfamily)